MFIFALAVITGYVIYAMSPEERAQRFARDSNIFDGHERKSTGVARSRIRSVTRCGNARPVPLRPQSWQGSASLSSC